MIRHHTLTLLVASAVLAQKTGDAPVFKTQARALMDPAVEMVPAVHVELQSPLLRDLALLYTQFDKKKAAKLFDEAFQAALAVADPERSRQQGAVIRELAAVDAGRALELCGQLPPHAGQSRIKPEAYERVLEMLLTQDQIGRAVEALNAYGAGEYPFKAACAVMEKLPGDDGRRLTIFGAATAAYQATPRGDFGSMIQRVYKTLPHETVQAALGVMVSALLEAKKDGEPLTFTAIATPGGSAAFGSQQELELFKIYRVLEIIDPKQAAEVLAKKPGLREALSKMPEGVESQGSVSTSRVEASGGDAAGQEVARQLVAEMNLLNRAHEAAAKNPRGGIELAGKLEDPNLQGQVLARIAATVAEKDPQTAEAALTKAVALLDKMDKPLPAAMTALELLGAAQDAKLKEMTARILEKGFALVERLAKEDRDAKLPNKAPRDLWPSTQVARMMMNAAGAAQGPEAMPMLERWRDAELRSVAQVALARSLLGLELHELNMSVTH